MWGDPSSLSGFFAYVSGKAYLAKGGERHYLASLADYIAYFARISAASGRRDGLPAAFGGEELRATEVERRTGEDGAGDEDSQCGLLGDQDTVGTVLESARKLPRVPWVRFDVFARR